MELKLKERKIAIARQQVGMIALVHTWRGSTFILFVNNKTLMCSNTNSTTSKTNVLIVFPTRLIFAPKAAPEAATAKMDPIPRFFKELFFSLSHLQKWLVAHLQQFPAAAVAVSPSVREGGKENDKMRKKKKMNKKRRSKRESRK